MYAHISYDDLPATWSQLYTSLVVLISEWQKREVREDFGAYSVQSQFKSFLQGNEDSGDLIANFDKSFIHNAENCDHELPDHNCAIPYLEYFLATLLNLDHNNLDKALKNKDVFAYFWYKRNVLKMIISESGYVTAEQQADLSSLTAEVGKIVVTVHNIHSLLHCLPYMQDPHTVVLNKSFMGTQAVRELSRFLAGDSWSDDYSGIRHFW